MADDPTTATISYAPLPSLVLQCGCRRIVGDSTEFLCTVSCGGLRLVVLRGELQLGAVAMAGGWRGSTCRERLAAADPAWARSARALTPTLHIMRCAAVTDVSVDKVSAQATPDTGPV